MTLEEINNLAVRWQEISNQYQEQCVLSSENGVIYVNSEFCQGLHDQAGEALQAYEAAIAEYNEEHPTQAPTSEFDENGNPVTQETHEYAGNVLVEPVCEIVRSQIIEYIDYYADKFPQIVQVVNETTDDTGTSSVIGRPSSYNQTKYDLNKSGNKLIRILGGAILPESFEEEYPIFAQSGNENLAGDGGN